MNSSKLTLVKNVLRIAVALLAATAEGGNQSLQVPLFPLEAKNVHGVSKSMIGLVYAGMQMGGLFSATLIALFAKPHHQQRLFSLGVLFSGVACIVFGILTWIHNKALYIFLCFLTRVIMGCAVGNLWSSAIPLFSSLFPRHAGRIISSFELCFGVGMTLFFPLGSIMHKSGGYVFPFVVFGAIECSLSVVSWLFSVERSSEAEAHSIDDDSSDLKTSHSAKDVLAFVRKPQVIALSSILFFFQSFYSFIGVALANYLNSNFGISSDISGYYMAPLTLGYLLFSPIIGFLNDKGLYDKIYIASGILSTTCYLLLFLPRCVAVFRNIVYIEVVIFFVGGCFSMTILPFFFVLTQTAEAYNVASRDSVRLIVSSWQVGVIYIGGVFGSFVIGGVFNQLAGFNVASLIASFLSFLSLLSACISLKHVRSFPAPVSTVIHADEKLQAEDSTQQFT